MHIQFKTSITLPSEGVCLLNVESNFLLDDLPLGILALQPAFAQLFHDVTLFTLRVFQEFPSLIQLLGQGVLLLEGVHSFLQMDLESFVALCETNMFYYFNRKSREI